MAVTPDVTMHFPCLTDDVESSWAKEVGEISPSHAAFAQIEVMPTECAALSIVSREVVDDSSPDSASVIGQSIANSLATPGHGRERRSPAELLARDDAA